MTIQKFQKTVTKTDWYGKYFWYLFSIALIGVSIFLFFDLMSNPNKYNLRHTYILAFFVFAFFFFLGCRAFYLIPNRYKVLSIDNNLRIATKKEIVSKLFDKLNIRSIKDQDTFYSFTYQRKWWTKDYDGYIGIDKKRFYVSVFVTTSYWRGGFIDFGGSEKLRKKVVSQLFEILAE